MTYTARRQELVNTNTARNVKDNSLRAITKCPPGYISKSPRDFQKNVSGISSFIYPNIGFSSYRRDP
jgi:hypothetical protein